MSEMGEKELNSGTSIWALNKCNAHPNKPLIREEA